MIYHPECGSKALPGCSVWLFSFTHFILSFPVADLREASVFSMPFRVSVRHYLGWQKQLHSSPHATGALEHHVGTLPMLVGSGAIAQGPGTPRPFSLPTF